MNMKNILAFVLALVMVASMAACSGGKEPLPTTSATTEANGEATTEAAQPSGETQPAPGAVSASGINVTLTEVGTAKAEPAYFEELPLNVAREGENYLFTLLSYQGEDLIGKTYHSYDYFGKGMAVGYTYDGEIPTCELVNADTGEILLADGAAKIEQLSDRFYYVIYATEVTENQDECFIYFTSSLISLTPGEDDVMYKGYGKVYDLEKAQFVPELTIENPGDEAIICGSTVCVETNWYEYDLYLEDGTVIPGIANLNLSDDHMMVYDYDNVTLYDSNFQEITVLKDVSPICDGDGYSDTYFAFENDDYLNGVIDINGNEILPAKFDGISDYWNGYFVVYGEDSCYGLYDLSGAEVLPCEYDFIYTGEDGPYVEVNTAGDASYIYGPGFGLLDVTDLYDDDSCFYKYDENGGSEYLILSTGEYKTLEDEDIVGPGLVYSEEAGFIDVITGETLLAGEFDQVEYTDEYIYILTDGTWTIYQANMEM